MKPEHITADKHFGVRPNSLTYSVFRSVTDLKSLERIDCTWPELVERVRNPQAYPGKRAQPLLKLATFGDQANSKGSLRHDGNVAQIHGVEADYDDGEVSIGAAVERLRSVGIRAVVYTSASHTAAAPRWRVLAPLSGPVDPALRHELVSLLNGALGGILAGESWTLSQTYYFGAVADVWYEAHEVEGQPLDVHAFAPGWVPMGPGRAAAPTDPKPTRLERLAMLESDDATARRLNERQMIKSRRADGALNVQCPASDEHTTDSGETATVYYLPHTGGFRLGTFVCKHGHCQERPQSDYLQRLGFDIALEEFADETVADGRPRFTPVAAHEFADAAPPAPDIIEGVLPRAELVTLFGESGSGKTFLALDLVGAVARGERWRDRRVRQGRVVYVVAEGVGGFRKRLRAYGKHHDVDLASVALSVIPDCPNLFGDDDKPLASAILAGGGADLIVVDTLAQATAGANENSGEDMGKVLAHCRRLHRATGATILLVHHAGKDTSKGARGWSGVRAAVDAELEVSRDLTGRSLRITKQKDGEDGSVYPFRLEPLVVGEDTEGMPIISCVAVEDAPRATGPKPIGKWQIAVNKAIHELIGFDGELLGVDKVVGLAVSQIPLIDGKRDRRKELARRALTELADAGLVVIAADETAISLPDDERTATSSTDSH